MKGTLRLKTENGKLSAEYSELEKPKIVSGEQPDAENENQQNDFDYRNSFQSITLSQECEQYFNTVHIGTTGYLKMFPEKSLELSGKDLDCFYVDDVQLGIVKDERVKVLHLKTVTPNESLSNGSLYYPLWKFFNDEHNLVLLDSDIQEIINQVEKFNDSQTIS